MYQSTRRALILLVSLVVPLLAGCADYKAQAEQRKAYWEQQLKENAAPGTPFPQVESWLIAIHAKYEEGKPGDLNVTLETLPGSPYYCSKFLMLAKIKVEPSQTVTGSEVRVVNACA